MLQHKKTGSAPCIRRAAQNRELIKLKSDLAAQYHFLFVVFGPTFGRRTICTLGISRPQRIATARTWRIRSSVTRRSPLRVTLSSVGTVTFFRLTGRFRLTGMLENR